MRLIFDLEADNLLDDLTKIHCIVTQDYDTGEIRKFTPKTIGLGIEHLEEATELIGHNIIDYDIPAIQKVFPKFSPKAKITDTLVMSRVAFPHRRELDFDLHRKKKLPPTMIGRHSLESWGYRLGFHKGDFGKQENAWERFSLEMLEYCVQDVLVNVKIYDMLMNLNIPNSVYALEHDVYNICREQKKFGFPFDLDKAVILYDNLLKRKKELVQEITELLGGSFLYNLGETIPKRSLKYSDSLKADRMEGCAFSKIKFIEFNPNSRVHVAERLIEKCGWKPVEYGKDGKPTLNEATIKNLKHPIKDTLSEYYMIEKRLGMLSDGRQAWLKCIDDDGAIHGSINTMGAGTSRCTHSSPNMAQIPSVGAPWGKECRELFHAPKPWKLFGTDASGLELRMLAHYMARWDKGAYGKIILEGDIHTENQKAAGLPTRNNAKTFIYAFLYGAGDEKIGSIVGGGKQKGKALKNEFFKKIPAIKRLLNAVQETAKRQGYVKGLDGRTIPVRSSHSALNFLLQGAGAIVCKQWMVYIHKILKERGYTHGIQYKQVAFVHDELQILFNPELLPEKELKQISQEAMSRTQETLKVRLKLDVDSCIGDNYAETH